MAMIDSRSTGTTPGAEVPPAAGEAQTGDAFHAERRLPTIPERPLLPMPTSGKKEDMDKWLLDCAFRRNFFGSGN
jgi:hypothetical protein